MEDSDDQWRMELRCPNCESREQGLYPHGEVELFSTHLDRGTDRLIDTLELVSRANMLHDVERILHALQHDHIVPEDF